MNVEGVGGGATATPGSSAAAAAAAGTGTGASATRPQQQQQQHQQLATNDKTPQPALHLSSDEVNYLIFRFVKQTNYTKSRLYCIYL